MEVDLTPEQEQEALQVLRAVREVAYPGGVYEDRIPDWVWHSKIYALPVAASALLRRYPYELLPEHVKTMPPFDPNTPFGTRWLDLIRQDSAALIRHYFYYSYSYDYGAPNPYIGPMLVRPATGLAWLGAIGDVFPHVDAFPAQAFEASEFQDWWCANILAREPSALSSMRPDARLPVFYRESIEAEWNPYRRARMMLEAPDHVYERLVSVDPGWRQRCMAGLMVRREYRYDAAFKDLVDKLYMRWFVTDPDGLKQWYPDVFQQQHGLMLARQLVMNRVMSDNKDIAREIMGHVYPDGALKRISKSLQASER